MTAAAREWTFLTNHALVLLCVASEPNIRMRDIAERVGITERAAHRIVADLIKSGYIVSRRVGRRNHYRVRLDRRLRHPITRQIQVRDLVAVIGNRTPDPSRPTG
jgi:predicted transcriptional regulator